jgi:hypothetical protein
MLLKYEKPLLPVKNYFKIGSKDAEMIMMATPNFIRNPAGI